MSDGEFLTGIAESIALGARCLDDLAVARGDVAQSQLRGYEILAPQTAGAWLRRFTLGHLGQLNRALCEVQRTDYVAAGVREVTLDFDSTYLFSRSKRRQGVDRTYKKATPCTRCCVSTPRRAPRCTPGCVAARPARQPGCARS